MPREHERVPLVAEVLLEFASGRREVRISDLSEGGCYVETWATVRTGDPVRFEIILPKGGGKLPVTGEVAYAFDGMGFGVKFIGMGAGQLAQVRELVGAGAPA